MKKKLFKIFALTIMVSILSAASMFAVCFAAEKNTCVLPNDLSSVGEIASSINPVNIYSKAAKNYEELKKTYKNKEHLGRIGFGKPKVLKPIYISCYKTHALSNKHITLASRSGNPAHSHKVKVDIAPLIEKYANKYKVDPHLVKAIMKTESNFNPYAVSPWGAKGLMQLMPATAKSLGVTDIFDPEQNIHAGTRYIKGLIERMGNMTFAIAAYNAGPYNVKKYGGVPPFAETRNFVRKVMRHYNNR
ncbi:MAG: lytic transglycosylase domain-containing protein [Armatimonadota bacterium]